MAIRKYKSEREWRDHVVSRHGTDLEYAFNDGKKRTYTKYGELVGFYIYDKGLMNVSGTGFVEPRPIIKPKTEMYFKQFKEKLIKETGIVNTQNQFILSDNGSVYKDSVYIGKFNSLKEATMKYVHNIEEDTVAALIRKHYPDIRVTDTSISEYIETFNNRVFKLDPVLIEMYDNSEIIAFKLKDGNTISITTETLQIFNERLLDKPELVEYMSLSKNNFLKVSKEL